MMGSSGKKFSNRNSLTSRLSLGLAIEKVMPAAVQNSSSFDGIILATKKRNKEAVHQYDVTKWFSKPLSLSHIHFHLKPVTSLTGGLDRDLEFEKRTASKSFSYRSVPPTLQIALYWNYAAKKNKIIKFEDCVSLQICNI